MIITEPGQPVGTSRTASVRLPSIVRVSLVRGIIEIKQFARQREYVIFTFALPIILLVLFGQIFHGEVAQPPSTLSGAQAEPQQEQLGCRGGHGR